MLHFHIKYACLAAVCHQFLSHNTGSICTHFMKASSFAMLTNSLAHRGSLFPTAETCILWRYQVLEQMPEQMQVSLFQKCTNNGIFWAKVRQSHVGKSHQQCTMPSAQQQILTLMKDPEKQNAHIHAGTRQCTIVWLKDLLCCNFYPQMETKQCDTSMIKSIKNSPKCIDLDVQLVLLMSSVA